MIRPPPKQEGDFLNKLAGIFYMAAKENFEKILLVLALIAVLGLVAFSFTKLEKPERDIITVSGTHQLEVAPDQGIIVLEVVTRDQSASVASKENANLLNKVFEAIKAEGVADSDLETTNVYLSKVTEWENNSMVDKGYEQRTTVKVTVNDLAKVGAVLDAAVSGGANSIQSVEFRLKPESESRYKQEALAKATELAKTKAQTLATTAGAKLGKITSLSESSYTPVWYNRYNVYDKAMESMPSATPISPEKVSLSVTVSISYELK